MNALTPFHGKTRKKISAGFQKANTGVHRIGDRHLRKVGAVCTSLSDEYLRKCLGQGTLFDLQASHAAACISHPQQSSMGIKS